MGNMLWFMHYAHNTHIRIVGRIKSLRLFIFREPQPYANSRRCLKLTLAATHKNLPACLYIYCNTTEHMVVRFWDVNWDIDAARDIFLNHLMFGETGSAKFDI